MKSTFYLQLQKKKKGQLFSFGSTWGKVNIEAQLISEIKNTAMALDASLIT